MITTKLDNYTLQLFIIKVPRHTMTIYITFEFSIRSMSRRIEKVSAIISDVDSNPRLSLSEGSVLHTSRRRSSGRLSTLNTPSKSHRRALRKRSISSEFIPRNRRRCFCLGLPRWCFQIRRRQLRWQQQPVQRQISTQERCPDGQDSSDRVHPYQHSDRRHRARNRTCNLRDL